MALERNGNHLTLRERFFKPGLGFHETANGKVPYSERAVPGQTKIIMFPGYCDDPDPNDEALDGFAELGHWPIRLSEPVGGVFSFNKSAGIKLRVGDIDAYVDTLSKLTTEGEDIDLIGCSQGGVLALKVARQISERNRIRRIGLVVPGGCMNGHDANGQESDKKIELLRHAGGWIAEQGTEAITIFREEGPRSVIRGCRTLGHMFADPVRSLRRARNVTEADIIPDIFYLIDTQDTQFTTVVGEYDKLFPGHIVESNIKDRGLIYSQQQVESNPRVIKVPTGHDTKIWGRAFAQFMHEEMEKTEQLALAA